MESVWNTEQTDKEWEKSLGPGVGTDLKCRSLSLECVRRGLRVGGGLLSPLMRGTSSQAQAHFLFLKVNRQSVGVWGLWERRKQ